MSSVSWARAPTLRASAKVAACSACAAFSSARAAFSLARSDEVTLDDWRVLLEWLSTGVVGLVPKRRLHGLRLLATDQEWSWRSGPELAGPSEALAMAVTGRPVALADLTGPGVQDLRDRLVRP
jgi:hypothetical protein